MNNFNNISKDIVLHNLIRLNQLVFEVTDACNLHCKYCAYADLYGGYDQRTDTNMSFTKAKLIIDYLQNIWEKNFYQDMGKKVSIGFYGGQLNKVC